MLVWQVHVLADTGNDDSRPLLLGFRHHDVCHDTGVVVVEVTDRCISKDEVERLTECSHHRHTLLLSERHSSNLGIHLVGDTEHIKPFQDLLTALESGNLVLDFYILQSGKLREETKFLKEVADMALSYLHPILYLIICDSQVTGQRSVAGGG